MLFKFIFRYVQDFLNLKIPMIEPVRTIVRDVADILRGRRTFGSTHQCCANSIVNMQGNKKRSKHFAEKPDIHCRGTSWERNVYLHNTTNKKTPFTVCKPQSKGKGKDGYTCEKTWIRFKVHELCDHTCAVAKREGIQLLKGSFPIII